MDKDDQPQTLTGYDLEKGDQPQTLTGCAIARDDDSQPRGEQVLEISDEDEDELVIYCAFSDPVSEFDEPRPEFDFSKPVQFVAPVRRSTPETEYAEEEAAREKEEARAQRCRKRCLAVANGDTSVKLPKVTLRRINGGPPHKGGQLPSRFSFK